MSKSKKKKDQVKKESSMNDINQEQETKQFGESLANSKTYAYLDETRERRDGPGGN